MHEIISNDLGDGWRWEIEHVKDGYLPRVIQEDYITGNYLTFSREFSYPTFEEARAAVDEILRLVRFGVLPAHYNY